MNSPRPKPKAPTGPRPPVADEPVMSPEQVEQQKRHDEELRRQMQAEAHAASPEGILLSRRFNHLKPPPPVREIYSLAEQIIGTPGNLVAIGSAVKTGKSAVVGTMLAATMTTDGRADLLGFWSKNPDGLAVLHFDSEQSRADHWYCVKRALKRAGVSEPPVWLYSYCLTGFDYKTAWGYVEDAIEIAVEECGGIHSVLLDGIADFVADVNDAQECNKFVSRLHDLAIKYDCCIVGVIHFNPGNNGKTRGHLGSQLERKAETNLQLDKDENEITTIWSEKQRRAPITKANGPAFRWDDEAGMHLSVPNPTGAKSADKADAKLAGYRREAEMVIAQGAKPLRYSEVVERIKDSFDITTTDGAKKKLRNWVTNGIVSKTSSGKYVLGSPS